jgi:transcriptional regulator with XRE-family HTH domain
MRLLLAHDFDMGERGKSRRVALGLTVLDVASRMHCSIQRVYNLEAQGCGGLAVLKRWAAALDMDPRELAFGKQQSAPLRPSGTRAVQRSRER